MHTNIRADTNSGYLSQQQYLGGCTAETLLRTQWTWTGGSRASLARRFCWFLSCSTGLACISLPLALRISLPLALRHGGPAVVRVESDRRGLHTDTLLLQCVACTMSTERALNLRENTTSGLNVAQAPGTKHRLSMTRTTHTHGAIQRTRNYTMANVLSCWCMHET